MQDLVRLVYAGDILEGHREEAVRRSLGQWLKLDDARLAALFSGRKVVIKKDVALDAAEHWVAQFRARGARLIVEAPRPAAASPALPPAAPTAPPAPAEPPRPPMNLSPGLAADSLAAAVPPPWAQPPRPPVPPPAGTGFPPLDLSPPPAPPAPAPSPAGSFDGLSLVPLAHPPVAPAAAPAAGAPDSWRLAGTDPAAAPPPIKTIAPPSTEQMQCPACGEWQSKRILCRGCACNMEVALATKQQEAEAARAERLAEAEARRQRMNGGRSASSSSRAGSRLQRDEEHTEYLGSEDAPLFGLSFEGRMPRLRYFFSGLIAWGGIFLSALLLALLPGVVAMMGLGFIGLALVVVWSLRVTVLRMHDIGHSGWWALLLLVPYVNVIASLVILLLPSEDGANAHGPKPVDESGRRVALVLAIFVLLVMIVLRLGWSAFQREVHRMQNEADDRPDVTETSDEPLPPRAQLASLLNGDRAADRFQHDYWPATGHRAFAVSQDGASGWYARAHSIDQAVREALASCDHDRRPYTAECYIVHVDSDWAMR